MNEIMSASDNFEPFYNRKMMMWKNLYAKQKKGIFDPVKAEKLFDYLTTSISKYHKDQFGTVFSKAERDVANKEMVAEFIDSLPEIKSGAIGVNTVMVPQVIRARSGKYYNPVRTVRAKVAKKKGVGILGIAAIGIAAYLILKK